MFLFAFVAFGITACLLPNGSISELGMGRKILLVIFGCTAIGLLVNAISSISATQENDAGVSMESTAAPANETIHYEITQPQMISPESQYSTETINAFTTGYSYYENEQFDLAFPLIMQAALDGYPEGEVYVGCCYRDGKGVEQDAGAAFDWFSIAANHGNAQAQYNLGYCYYRGDGVRTNDSLAFEWFLKSAEQGNRYGLLWTGFCYHKGVGVAQDYDLAQFYYESAKLAGNQDAVDRLAELYQDRGY